MIQSNKTYDNIVLFFCVPGFHRAIPSDSQVEAPAAILQDPGLQDIGAVQVVPVCQEVWGRLSENR